MLFRSDIARARMVARRARSLTEVVECSFRWRSRPLGQLRGITGRRSAGSGNSGVRRDADGGWRDGGRLAVDELERGVHSIEQGPEHIARLRFDVTSARAFHLELVGERHRHEQQTLRMVRAGGAELAQLAVDDAGKALELVRTGVAHDPIGVAADAELYRRAIHATTVASAAHDGNTLSAALGSI